MRVTFDSNAWEAIFSIDNIAGSAVRAALEQEKIEGFICAAAFRIEAISKRNRPAYFAQPYMDVSVEIVPSATPGQFMFMTSMGPDNRKHPGIPAIQAEKLGRALAAGVKLIRGENWMGLPVPGEISDSNLYVQETPEEANERQSRQLMASSAIDGRSVGNAAFVAAEGWIDRPRTQMEEKELSRACAEWADGELVAAHIAYRNNVLCTNDRARMAGHSIFDVANRRWLALSYGVVFMTVDELEMSLINGIGHLC